MSNAEQIEKIVCPECCAVLDAGDKFCRHCGAPTDPAHERPRKQLETKPRAADWSQRPGTVLVMLFAVLGPLAIPMLWRSRYFTTLWKVVLTVLVLVLTGLVIYLLWYVVNQYLLRLMDELKQIRNM